MILILLDMPLIHFSLSGPFMRCQYSWALTVLGQMTMFAILGCRVSSSVDWSITAQSYLSGRMRGSGFLGAEVGTLMVATWFAMRSCPWRGRFGVLYVCTCSTVRLSFAFWCGTGGISSVSYGMIWGVC